MLSEHALEDVESITLNGFAVNTGDSSKSIGSLINNTGQEANEI